MWYVPCLSMPTCRLHIGPKHSLPPRTSLIVDPPLPLLTPHPSNYFITLLQPTIISEYSAAFVIQTSPPPSRTNSLLVPLPVSSSAIRVHTKGTAAWTWPRSVLSSPAMLSSMKIRFPSPTMTRPPAPRLGPRWIFFLTMTSSSQRHAL